jgi:hypothetical protein
MALPKRIEEQGKRAEELQKQQIDLQQGVTPPPVEAPPVVEKKADPPPPVEPAAEVKPAILDGPESKEWEQRYRVLQGKYNGEVPTLQRENRQLRSDLQAVKDEVGQLRDQLRSQPAAPKTEDQFRELKEQYGPEFVDFIKQVATSVVPQPQTIDMAAVDERIRPVEEATVRSLKNSFFGELAMMAPDWERKNTDSGFLSWLMERDSLSGRSRQELFDEAYSRLDAQRVSAFFNGYGGAPNVGVASTVADTMVTPSTARNQPPPPAGKKIWRQAEIANFFTLVRQGRYSAEEAAKIEQDIFAAQAENRVR